MQWNRRIARSALDTHTSTYTQGTRNIQRGEKIKEAQEQGMVTQEIKGKATLDDADDADAGDDESISRFFASLTQVSIV